jgi:hypothetical protein
MSVMVAVVAAYVPCIAWAGATVTLTPGIPLISQPAIQPNFGITLLGDESTDANGNSERDLIADYLVTATGYSSWTYSPWTDSFTTTWFDPRGALGVGTYSYSVVASGYHKEPYNNGWVDGHDEDEHDNPEDPEEVTGSHWVEGQYDAGFNWQWQQLGSASLTFTIASIVAQTISFSSPGARVFGDVFNPGASASSGLPVTYTIISGPATVLESNVTVTGVGSVTIQASQSGGLNAGTYYSAAANVQQTITTSKVEQTITFPAQAALGYGVHPLSSLGISMSANALAPVVTVTAGPASISGNNLTITASTGSVTLTASQAGDANHFPATPVSRTFSLTKGAQIISAPSLANRSGGDAPFSAAATVNSGLPISYTIISGPAFVDAGTGMVTLAGIAGTVVIRASQDAGDGNWNPASPVNYGFTVTVPVNWVSISLPAIGPFYFSASATNVPAISFTTDRLPMGTLTAYLQTPAGITIGSTVLAVAQPTITNVTVASGALGTGTGLAATYYNTTGLTSPGFSQVDAFVGFDWGDDGPGVGQQDSGGGYWEDEYDNPEDPEEVTGSHWVDYYTNWDLFSIRWTGFVQAPSTESFTFITTSDDGVRLWVNGVQVINDWTEHGATDRLSSPIALVQGQVYAITLEYFESWGQAQAQLSWQSPTRSRQIIPQGYLYTIPPTTTIPSSLNWLISGLSIPAGQAPASNYRLYVGYAPADSQTVVSNATRLFDLSVIPVPPSITTQPASVSVSTGQSAFFSVIATGTPAPAFQWKKGINAIPGATTSTLMFSSVQPADEGSYSVVVQNTAGGVTSSSANLLVGATAPPSITLQPAGASLEIGQEVALYVGATGNPLYQWYKDGVPIPGATNNPFVFDRLAASDAGTYSAVVSNSLGTQTSSGASVSTLGTSLGASHGVVGSGYVAGGNVTISNTITFTGTPDTLGYRVVLPIGWTYISSTAGDIKPQTGGTKVLEWGWITTPASPVTFSYTLSVPSGASSSQPIPAVVLVRRANVLAQQHVAPTPLVVNKAP